MSVAVPGAFVATSLWAPLEPERARELVDARLQLHHAVQLATAAGISFLAPEPDDSHTNLEWRSAYAALASRAIGAAQPFRVAVRAADLTLLVIDETGGDVAEFALHGHTIARAADWIRHEISQRGLDATRYTLRRHYVIPAHPVDTGRTFALEPRANFEELARWFADADLLLRDLESHTEGASAVRCWPHHFDIAMLVSVRADASGTRTIGVGLEPGDEYYAEPYLYVNLFPAPERPELPSLAVGRWHTSQWLGAVFPGSELTRDGLRQHAQLRDFAISAMDACRRLLA